MFHDSQGLQDYLLSFSDGISHKRKIYIRRFLWFVPLQQEKGSSKKAVGGRLHTILHIIISRSDTLLLKC